MDTYSSKQVALFYKEALKQECKEKADSLALQRAAHHAKDIKDIHKKLTNASQDEKEKKVVDVKQLLQAFANWGK